MLDLANWHGGAGPGPWTLLFPLVWVTAVAGAVHLLRRGARRGRGPWRAGGPAAAGSGTPAQPGNRPSDLLGRRFASGEIDEDEYWRRLSVLREAARPGEDGPV